MLNFDMVRAWRSGEVVQSYTARDTILYALGLGAGANLADERVLRFVYEKGLVALPAMAAVLASPGFWMRDRPELGIDFVRLVHGEQTIRVHEALQPQATLVGESVVTRLIDKGEGKGAVMHVEKRLLDQATRRHIATTEQVLFLRGNGGFSKQGGGDPPADPPGDTPASAPERTVVFPTRPDQAALYRLSGDLNPLHIDPSIAAKAGFAKPILHGLATYGIACLGIIEQYCNFDPTLLKSIRARLSAPVYPGETIQLECWRIGDDLAFRARVIERNVLVLTHGRATL
jgi:acyl dehydratase